MRNWRRSRSHTEPPLHPSPRLGSLPAAGRNLAEFMRAIVPNSNIIFNLQIKDPTGEKPAPSPIPFDYQRDRHYPGWLAIDQPPLRSPKPPLSC
jgi:hypothetical protein